MSGPGDDSRSALWRFQGYHLGGLALAGALLAFIVAEGDGIIVILGLMLVLAGALTIVRARTTRRR